MTTCVAPACVLLASWQFSWLAAEWLCLLMASLVALVLTLVIADRRARVVRLMLTGLLLLMLSGLRLSAPQRGSHQEEPSAGAAVAGLQLVDVVMPELALVGDQVSVDVVVHGGSQPNAASLDASVELVDADGVVVDRGVLKAADALSSSPHDKLTHFTATLSWQPTMAGIRRFTARLLANNTPPLAAELPQELPAVCNVVDRSLRVLLIDGGPRWETRHLVRLLQATPGVEVEQVLLDVESVASLPTTRSAAAAFDLVVLGVFDPRDLAASQSAAICTAVEQDGLGVLWMLDGRSDLAALAASPLGQLLPCRPDLTDPPRRPPEGYRVEATPAAAGFRWIAPLLHAIEASQAEVFFPAAVMPRHGTTLMPLVCRQGSDAAAVSSRSGGRSVRPGVLVDHTSSGRVLAMLVETWRWRAAGQSNEIDRFWQAATRYVAQPRLQQRVGPTLVQATREAELIRQRQRRRLLATKESDVSAHPRSWGQPDWNHPVLITIMMLVAVAGWLWADRSIVAEDSQHEGRSNAE